MTFPQRQLEDEMLESCISCDTAFAAWTLKRYQEQIPLTPDALRDAWRQAWLQGLIYERIRQHREKVVDDLARGLTTVQ